MPEAYWPVFIRDEERSLDKFLELIAQTHPDDIKRWNGVLGTLIQHGLQDVRIGEIVEKLEANITQPARKG